MLQRFFQRKTQRGFSDISSSGKADRQYYNSEYDAVSAWSGIYRSLAIRKEYAAFVYVVNIDGRKRYYTGRTYAGMGKCGRVRPNVVLPFLYQYSIQSMKERFKYNAKPVAFSHTHPKPLDGFTYKHHSSEDLFLLKLPGISAVYVVPYENNQINRAKKETPQKL